MVLKEQGDEHIGQRSSDVALVVREELHPQFERKDNDLLTRVEVPLVQALTCEYVEVPLLDGDSMEVCSGSCCESPIDTTYSICACRCGNYCAQS